MVTIKNITNVIVTIYQGYKYIQGFLSLIGVEAAEILPFIVANE